MFHAHPAWNENVTRLRMKLRRRWNIRWTRIKGPTKCLDQSMGLIVVFYSSPGMFDVGGSDTRSATNAYASFDAPCFCDPLGSSTIVEICTPIQLYLSLFDSSLKSISILVCIYASGGRVLHIVATRGKAPKFLCRPLNYISLPKSM